MAAYGRDDAVLNSAAPDRRERQLPADAPTCSWSPDRPRRAASRARLRQAGGRRDPDRSGGVVNPRDGPLRDPHGASGRL